MKNTLAFLLTLLLAFTLAHAQQQPAPPPPPPPVPAQPQVQQQQQNPAAQFPDGSAYKNSNITYNIIDATNSTFGYDVFVDGKLMIHQTSIPSLPGNDGFKTKDDAAKVAELVMYKIRKGEMPPTVTADEMKNLGIK